jgi:tripartite-type tricarboxylate transporter receptor subunit TctC
MRTRPETPEEFARFLNDDTARWEKVIRGNNLQVD